MQGCLRRFYLPVFLLIFLPYPLVAAAEGKSGNVGFVAVLPLPTKKVTPTAQDEILATMAQQLRAQFSVQVLAGRAVGRAVWGTLGTGLEETMASFTSKVAEGKQSYQLLQIGRSLKLMGEAKYWQDFCGPEVRELSWFTDQHVYTGLALLAQGKQEQAAAEFRQAVSYDPELSMSVRQFPPDVVQAFDRAKKQLLSGNATQVVFISRPAGARLTIDGKPRGTTPVAGTPLYPGRHFIRLELDGYSPWTLNLPEEVPPREVKAHLVPLWTGESMEDLLGIATAVEQPNEVAMAKLRLLAGFFRADALVLTFLSKEDRNYHLGVRLFVTRPEELARARLFNLGFNREDFARKIQGVVSTMNGLNEIRRQKVAYGSAAAAGLGKSKPTQLAKGGVAEPSAPWYKSWWFWTAVGAAVAGAATGVAIWLAQPEESWTLVVRP